MNDNSATHPYSTVRVLDNGDAYVSGVLPYDADGSIVRDPDRAVVQLLRVLEQRLTDVGYSLNDVVKATVFVTDISWRDCVNAAWVSAFLPPMPARTLVEVSNLPQNSPIEVDVILHRLQEKGL